MRHDMNRYPAPSGLFALRASYLNLEAARLFASWNCKGAFHLCIGKLCSGMPMLSLYVYDHHDLLCLRSGVSFFSLVDRTEVILYAYKRCD